MSKEIYIPFKWYPYEGSDDLTEIRESLESSTWTNEDGDRFLFQDHGSGTYSIDCLCADGEILYTLL